MKRKLTALLPCAAVLAADFYLLPLLIQNTGVAMLMMLCVMPLICFVTALLYGVRREFTLLLPVLVALLFAPTIFLYYNESAWGYTVVYAVLALAGNAVGKCFYQKR